MSALDQAMQIVIQQTSPPTALARCPAENKFDGRMGLRISAVFVIFLGSSIGAWFPVYAHRNRGVRVPEWAFFVAKYFGSGVIIATAFLHLLAPANEALTNPCLTGPITEYDWVEGIVLITIFLLFFIELMTTRYANFSLDHDPYLAEHHPPLICRPSNISSGNGHTPGNDHPSHSNQHRDQESTENTDNSSKDYAAQITTIFILEFGVIFHSIFVGLTLAVAGANFNTLYIVLVFHQTFEGLALGSRIAGTPWPEPKRWTPYVLALAFGISTPIAMAIGLGVGKTYNPGSQGGLIVNGVFDSISAGILIYTGLVELMAHEFMFNADMRRAKLSVVLSAFGMMCLGAGLMALLGKWA